jgi:hypothetical protein
MMSFGFVSTGIMLVALAFGIFGVGPNVREVGWAIEDSVAWVAERTPVALLIGVTQFVLWVAIALLITTLFGKDFVA